MNHEGFFTHINEIPIINTPDVFGLHANAEITYFTNAAKQLWLNLITMQSTEASGDTGFNKDEYVLNIAMDI